MKKSKAQSMSAEELTKSAAAWSRAERKRLGLDSSRAYPSAEAMNTPTSMC